MKFIKSSIERIRALIDDFWFNLPGTEPEYGEPVHRSPSAGVEFHMHVGQILEDDALKGEVVSMDLDGNFQIKIVDIYWDRLDSYIDVGCVYPMEKHQTSFSADKMQIWEIPGECMKRQTSQLLLYWEHGLGWSWDLDF